MMLLRVLRAFITTIITLLVRLADRVNLVEVIYVSGHKITKGHKGDAGYDLYTQFSTYVSPHSEAEIPVDTIISSRRLWFLLISRSSTLRRHGLMVSTAIIDNGYRGRMNISVYNTTNVGVWVEAGQRIGQVIPFILPRTVVVSGQLPSKDGRYDQGFGSTGL